MSTPRYYFAFDFLISISNHWLVWKLNSFRYICSTSQDEQPKSYNLTLRSKESIERAFLLLTNTTERSVDVYWINFTCQLIRYTTIEPNEQVALNTYSTHPWIFRDQHTGLKMHVNHQEVFWPEPWILTKLTTRTRITIHFPMQNLKTIALWKIVLHIESDERLDCLEIPRILLKELKTIYRDYVQYIERRKDER